MCALNKQASLLGKHVSISHAKLFIQWLEYTDAHMHAHAYEALWYCFGNDPSAGSPTETLLRLLPGSSHCDKSGFHQRISTCLKVSKQQSPLFSKRLSPGQRRAVCTKGRDVINVSWWLTLTRNSSFKGNNCNSRSRSRRIFKGLPIPFKNGYCTLIPPV